MMEIKSLKEIASLIRTGKTPPTKEDKYFNGEINWYSPGDLDKTKYLFTAKRTITQQAIEDKKAITFPKDTLLVGCIGDIGKLGITSELSSSNQQLTGILPNNETNVSYLYYWFKGNKKVLENYSNNAVVPILNNRTLETVKIPLPPLDQQKKIAAILDAADAYKQKTKALIEKYDELTQSLFLDMFGDPVTNPKGWEWQNLKDISDYFIGLTYKPENVAEDGIIVLRSSNIKDGELAFKDVVRVDNEVKPKLIVKDKDILMCSRNGSARLVGKVALIRNLREAMTFGAFMTIIRSDQYNYLLNYFRTLGFRRQIATGATSTVNQITKKMLDRIVLPKPPNELQNQFAERVQAIEVQKAQVQASLAQAEDLFNSLLQRAFKGELTN